MEELKLQQLINNEFYNLNQNIEDVLMDLRTYGGFKTYYKNN
jgi:hypothetical protein